MAKKGQRRRSKRGTSSRVTQQYDVALGYIALGSTTTLKISDLGGLGNRGDRPFKLQSVHLTITSAGPLFANLRVYGPQSTTDNVSATGPMAVSTVPRTISSRGSNLWYPGNTAGDTVLAAVDGLRGNKSLPDPNNSILFKANYLLGAPELTSLKTVGAPKPVAEAAVYTRPRNKSVVG